LGQAKIPNGRKRRPADVSARHSQPTRPSKGEYARAGFVGNQWRFSKELDFTTLEKHHHEDIAFKKTDAFLRPFHEIQFSTA
jgi:hypothetical protein